MVASWTNQQTLLHLGLWVVYFFYKIVNKTCCFLNKVDFIQTYSFNRSKKPSFHNLTALDDLDFRADSLNPYWEILCYLYFGWLLHSKNAGLFKPKVGSNMDKPNYWVKQFKTLPNGWVCPHLTQLWVQTTQHFLECRVFLCSCMCSELFVEFLFVFVICRKSSFRKVILYPTKYNSCP